MHVRDKQVFCRSRGFTLVELLIVVAIIGVLSTIAVPAYRRMVQKAKQVEAKLNLAGLYQVESAFFAEIGAYGNHITAMGFDVKSSYNPIPDSVFGLESTAWAAPSSLMPPSNDQLTYTVGFPTSADCAMTTQTSLIPGAVDDIGSMQSTVTYWYPRYYDLDTGTRNACATAIGPSVIQVCPVEGVPAGTPKIGVFSSAGGAATQWDQFTASASGVIAPGVDRANPNPSQLDVWTIDHNHILTNTNSGIL